MIAQFICFGQVLHGRMLRRQAALCKGEHTADAIHRRADFMRHPEQKARFELTGSLGFRETRFILFPLVLFACAQAEAEQITAAFIARLCGELNPAIIVAV